MAGFVRTIWRRLPEDAHLMLVGPDVSGVSDDPEGAEVLVECRDQWRRCRMPYAQRVHLAAAPDGRRRRERLIVNALQRHARVVVQKSLVEGFGLTVTEPMWKARPVVASRVGGIQDQIVDGRDGLLLDDPSDLDAFAKVLGRLLADPRSCGTSRPCCARSRAGRVRRRPAPDSVRRSVRAARAARSAPPLSGPQGREHRRAEEAGHNGPSRADERHCRCGDPVARLST